MLKTKKNRDNHDNRDKSLICKLYFVVAVLDNYDEAMTKCGILCVDLKLNYQKP